ncbi:MBL fold metallo-hydrolase [Bacillus sp. NTK071]|uniref:MBL fold metallo-hydrolase n=1 Tax=Bacillus sp. NTK071 TaxID=2802175 RepID=UPI00256FBAAF|nr:MBL fold metallo-hydrolase [Bacillus sp. NTK071]
MLFRQYMHTNPIPASYLFGCGSKASGVVVDPLQEEVDFYMREAKRLGMNIEYVIDTHLHADHISGGRFLAEKSEAKYVLHDSADTNYDLML